MSNFLGASWETLTSGSYNNSTSYYEFPASTPTAIAQSTLALVYPLGDGGAGGGGAIWGRMNSANTDGQRLVLIPDGGGTGGQFIDFVGDSATNGRPFIFSTGTTIQ